MAHDPSGAGYMLPGRHQTPCRPFDIRLGGAQLDNVNTMATIAKARKYLEGVRRMPFR